MTTNIPLPDQLHRDRKDFVCGEVARILNCGVKGYRISDEPPYAEEVETEAGWIPVGDLLDAAGGKP